MGVLTKLQHIKAECDHAKSELEQCRIDITNGMKQKGLHEKALEKKVLHFSLLFQLLMITFLQSYVLISTANIF